MKVHWTIFHGALAILSAVPLVLFGDDLTGASAVIALLAAVVISVLLNVIYANQLAGRPRSDGRKDADRRTGRFVFAALPVCTLIIGLARFLNPVESALGWGSIEATCLLVVEVGFVGVFLSSMTDRYLVTPWRDGVTGPPPFERSISSREAYTKLWLIHRLLGTFLFFVAFWVVAGLAWFKAYEASSSNSWLLFLLSLVSPAVFPAVAMRNWLRHVPDAIAIGFGHVDVRVGDYVEFKRGAADTDTGIVYEVSTDRGYIVLADDGRLWSLALSDAHPSKSLLLSHTPPANMSIEMAIAKHAAADLGQAGDYLAPRTGASPRWFIY